MKKVVLAGVIALLSLASCKKEDTTEPTPPVVVDTRDQMVGEYSLKLNSTYKYSNVSNKSDELTENTGTLIISKNSFNSTGLEAKIKIGSDEASLTISNVTNINNNVYLTIPNQTFGGYNASGSKSYISTSSKFDGVYSSSNKNIEFILLFETEETIDGVTVYVPVEQKMSATKN
jgi:uncharacterized lipoprotein YajG